MTAIATAEGHSTRAPLLAVRALSVEFPGERGAVQPVVAVDLEVRRGEMVGLVGESGSGKTLTALAILGLVPAPGRCRGEIRFDGRDLLAGSPRAWRAVRGAGIGMVFQEPAAALNPVMTIGAQLGETLRLHRRCGRREAHREAVRLLERVAMPDPEAALRRYPHQLSGGQRQRAMLALALAPQPRLLLADEPTTALDVTLEAEILGLLDRLRAELGLAVVLITHDLAVVAETCDRLSVMYSGAIVETGEVSAVFAAPAHPYTRGLLESLPRLGSPAARGALPVIPGRVPSPADRPAGCPFHPRCPIVEDRCRDSSPPVVEVAAGHRGACWRAEEVFVGAPVGEEEA
ncbi:MAG TPA: ABC transporter ATP-binding protein [Thermoanaerobaculia bacterium]|nr:ABC transporter ATP-binding protein [Thermoanaerobaculia bacterium]